jgi:hypothetical protein
MKSYGWILMGVAWFFIALFSQNDRGWVRILDVVMGFGWSLVGILEVRDKYKKSKNIGRQRWLDTFKKDDKNNG